MSNVAAYSKKWDTIHKPADLRIVVAGLSALLRTGGFRLSEDDVRSTPILVDGEWGRAQELRRELGADLADITAHAELHGVDFDADDEEVTKVRPPAAVTDAPLATSDELIGALTRIGVACGVDAEDGAVLRAALASVAVTREERAEKVVAEIRALMELPNEARDIVTVLASTVLSELHAALAHAPSREELVGLLAAVSREVRWTVHRMQRANGERSGDVAQGEDGAE